MLRDTAVPEADQVIAGIETEMKRLKGTSGAVRDEKIEEINNLMEDLDSCLQGFELDLEGLRESGTHTEWLQIYEGFRSRQQKLTYDFDMKKRMGGPTQAEAFVEETGGANDKQMLNVAQNLNTDAIRMLEGAEQQIGEMQDINVQAAETLLNDRETMMKIRADLGSIRNDLKIARKQMLSMTRRLATDKIFLCLIIVIIVVFIITVLWFMVGGSVDTSAIKK